MPGRVARRGHEPDTREDLRLAVVLDVGRALELDPLGDRVVVRPGGLALGALHVDRNAREQPVAAAVVEVQVRVDHAEHVARDQIRRRSGRPTPRPARASSRSSRVSTRTAPRGARSTWMEFGQRSPSKSTSPYRIARTSSRCTDVDSPAWPPPLSSAARSSTASGSRRATWVEVRSPYSGEVVGRVAKAGAAEAQRAVDAAARAMESPLPAHKRAEILVRVAGYLGRRHEEAARTISDEAGKPMRAARVEAARAMSTYTMAAVEARKLAGDVVPMDATQAGEGKFAFTLRQPLGVVGAISPFNFPLNLVAHKIAPALAAGCAVVLKPASATPLSALLLAELEEEAGLPAGWLNVLVGPSAEIGDVLVERRPRRRADLHRLGPGRLEAARARAPQEGAARARQRDAGDRRGGHRRRRRGGRRGRQRVLVRRPELHLRAARLRRTRRLRPLRGRARAAASTRSSSATRPTTTPTSGL